MRMNAMVVARRFLCVTCAALLWLSSVTDVQAQNVAAGAPITAADVSALRTSVEGADPTGCASVFRWTDDPLVPGQTPIKADHIIELRRAINEVVRGQCPTIHEQVTLEGVRLHDQAGDHLVDGFVLNSGSTRIVGRSLYVRVRFFDGNNAPIYETTNWLRGDGASTLDVQERQPFWIRIPDSEIEDWATFQVVSLEVDRQRPVLCSGCTRRYPRQRDQVTVDGISLYDWSGGSHFVEGFVLNSGSIRIAGRSLYVRARFFDGNNTPIYETTNWLRGDGASTLDVQERQPFWIQIPDGEIEGWATFQVVSFENDGRRVPCIGCDQGYDRQPEQVTVEGARFRDAEGRSSYVEGFVLNSGSTRIVGSSLYVRVRFFDGNSTPIYETTNWLRGDGASTLDVQERQPFWIQIPDGEIEGWATFQVVSFENDGRRVSCAGCDQRHGR